VFNSVGKDCNHAILQLNPFAASLPSCVIRAILLVYVNCNLLAHIMTLHSEKELSLLPSFCKLISYNTLSQI